jgi:hypothetical protein
MGIPVHLHIGVVVAIPMPCYITSSRSIHLSPKLMQIQALLRTRFGSCFDEVCPAFLD